MGGGELLASSALQLNSAGYGVLVVTSPRHIREIASGSRAAFIDHLKRNSIEYAVSTQINSDENVVKRITPSTVGLSFGAAWIFRKKFIDRFNGKLLNLHGTSFSWHILRDNRIQKVHGRVL